MFPYEECKDCVARPFCKRYSGEAQRPETPDWCNVRFRLHKALELSQIPKEYIGADLYRYQADSGNEKVLQKVRPYLEDIVQEVGSGLNMFFYSDKYGNGKTYHGAMFLNHYIYKTCLTERFDFEKPLALFIPYADLMDSLRYSRDEMDVVRLMERVCAVPLLLLDDVGSGTMSDYVREQTYLILNRRFNGRLSTVVTANHGLRELAKDTMLGARNVSRITARCDGAELTGSDRRRVRR